MMIIGLWLVVSHYMVVKKWKLNWNPGVSWNCDAVWVWWCSYWWWWWFQPNDDDQARVIPGTWYQVPTNRNCTKLDPEVHFESRTLKLGKWCNKKGHVRIGCQGNSDKPSQIGEWTRTDYNWQKCIFVQCYYKKQFVAFFFQVIIFCLLLLTIIQQWCS